MYGNSGTSMGLFDKLDRRSAQNIGEVSSLFTANRGMRMRYSNGGEYDDMTDDEYWQALSEKYAHRNQPILKNKKALIKKYGQEWWDKYRADLDEKAREFDLSEKVKERLIGYTISRSITINKLYTSRSTRLTGIVRVFFFKFFRNR